MAIRHVELQQHPIDSVLDRQLLAEAADAIETGKPVVIERPVGNVDRSVGAMLSGAVAKRYGHAGLPEDSITVKLKGTSGQSFAAFLAAGVTVELTGQANDYVGKGLSGGKLIVRPDPNLEAVAAEYTTLLRASVSAASDTGLGELLELSVVTERMTALLVGITPEYFLFAGLAPGALLGRARFALRLAGLALEREFD